MEAITDLVATAAYRPERQAAAAARQFVRELLRSWQCSGAYPGYDEIIDDAVLLTSELVTNAVLHARTLVRVACRCAGGAVEIAVVDYSPALLAPDQRPEIPAADRTGGRGLALPALLASAWGVSYTPGRKAVWFRIGAPDASVGWLADLITGAVLPDVPLPDVPLPDVPEPLATSGTLTAARAAAPRTGSGREPPLEQSPPSPQLCPDGRPSHR